MVEIEALPLLIQEENDEEEKHTAETSTETGIHENDETKDNEEDTSQENHDTEIDEEAVRKKEEEKREQEQLAKRRAEAKKGISITRSLITFGFESWIAFEPGNDKNVLYYSFIRKLGFIHS